MSSALRSLPALALLLLSACGDPQPPSKPPATPPSANGDADEDGVPDAQDCAPGDFTRRQLLPGFSDRDHDGVGDGAEEQVCSGVTLPRGWAPTGGDCAPFLASQWRLQSLFVDADRDGATVGEAQAYCIGDDPAAGLRVQRGTEDCDDTNPLAWRNVSGYADDDGDGMGAGALQTLCVGEGPVASLVATAGDCAPWDAQLHTLLPYAHRDVDFDGRTVPSVGEVCAGFALPQGYLAQASALGEDCHDADATRYELQPGFADTDLDGYGAGPGLQVCAGTAMPQGYSSVDVDCAAEDAQRWEQRDYTLRDADGDGRVVAFTPPQSFCVGSTDPEGYARATSFPEDCDDASATRWQQLAYAHRDADGDRHTVPEQGQQCSGAALPQGYAAQAYGADCNDADVALHTQLSGYPDTDGDGFHGGEAQTFCTGGTLPAGFHASGSDCAPEDATRFRIVTPKYLDVDGDGHTVPDPAPTAQCIGAQAPLPSVIVPAGNDCRDDDAALFLWRVLYPDRDGDGVGASPREVRCLGSGPLPAGYSLDGWDSNDGDPDQQLTAEDRYAQELLLGL